MEHVIAGGGGARGCMVSATDSGCSVFHVISIACLLCNTVVLFYLNCDVISIFNTKLLTAVGIDEKACCRWMR